MEKEEQPFLSESEVSVKIESCRVCLDTDTMLLMSLFEPYKETCVSQHIVAITGIEMSPGDGLPDRICSACLEELETAIHFKEKCEISNIQLHRNLLEEKVDIKKEELDEYEDLTYLESTSDHEDIVSDKQEDIDITTDKFIPPETHFECHDCGEVFKSKGKIRIHWQRTHKPKSYTCENCKRVFKSLIAYNRHKKIKTKGCVTVALEGVRVEGEGKSRVFHCSFCDYNSKHINYIRIHTVIHSGKKPFACNLCPKKYGQLNGLSSHRENIHKEYRLEMTCNICGKFIKGREKAWRHLRSHSDQRYQCDLCKKFLKSKTSLKDHFEWHTQVKKNMCDICGLRFFTKSALCTHKYSRHRENKFIQCKFCPYKAATKKIVVKHEKKHSENNFVCPKPRCNLIFESEQRFRIHEQSHIDGKIHECSLCKERFKRRVYWVTHMKRKHNTIITNDVKNSKA